MGRCEAETQKRSDAVTQKCREQGVEFEGLGPWRICR